MTFRFDDISVNTDQENLSTLLGVIFEARSNAQILLAVSPIVFSREQLPSGSEQRVHPTLLTAMSKLTPYYRGQSCGIPDWLQYFDTRVRFAGHGLAHVDHRLLNRQAQEMSILMSCTLARATTFIPPYNKYNDDTEDICRQHSITLVKFEDDWRHVLYNPYRSAHDKFYCHPYDISPSELRSWFGLSDPNRFGPE